MGSMQELRRDSLTGVLWNKSSAVSWFFDGSHDQWWHSTSRFLLCSLVSFICTLLLSEISRCMFSFKRDHLLRTIATTDPISRSYAASGMQMEQWCVGCLGPIFVTAAFWECAVWFLPGSWEVWVLFPSLVLRSRAVLPWDTFSERCTINMFLLYEHKM